MVDKIETLSLRPNFYIYTHAKPISIQHVTMLRLIGNQWL